MVGRIVSFIQKEIGGLHEAAYLLGGAAIASQLLALFRDRLLAHMFGAGQVLDIYYGAFRVPDILFATIGSLVSASVLIPFLSQKFKESDETGKHFFDAVFTVFFVTIIGAGILAWIFAPRLVPLLLPGFRGTDAMPTLVFLTRILLLSPVFLGFSNLFASITQLKSRFFIYALSPLLYNLGIIAGALFLVPLWGIPGLAVGVILGACAHMAIQLPFIVSQGLFPALVSVRRWKTAREVIRISIPRTLAISANELAELILISLASLLSIGSISVFNFSFNLQSVPLSIIGVSYSLAAFPTLAKYMSEGNGAKYVDYVVTTTRHIIFLCVPVTTLFIVLRAQIVRTILGSGKFSWADTRLTAAALGLFVLSLTAQSLILLFTRARYSTGNTKIPLLINVSASVFIVVFSFVLLHVYKAVPAFQLLLTHAFRVNDIPGTDVLVLPLAFSIGSTIAALIHIVSFHRSMGGMNRVVRTLVDVVSVSLVMGVVAYLSLNLYDRLFNVTTLSGFSTLTSIFLQGLVSGLVAIIVGIASLVFIGNREILEMHETLRRKFWKRPTPPAVVGPDAEDVI